MVCLMERGLLVFVLTGIIANVVFGQSHYNFVNTPLNWTNAQRVCRDLYTDLATLESAADVEAVLNTTSSYAGKAWIGLHDDLLNSWMWSLNDSSFYGEGEATFRNWLSGQPNNEDGQQYCVELLSGSPYFGAWSDSTCSVKRQFVCFNGTFNGTAKFVRIETLSNWTEAQRFCRENYVDLASIRNQTENEMVRSIADGNFVWIGLYRQKIWSDGSDSLYRNWNSSQPDSGGEQCVATSFETGLWSDESCSIQLPFVCHTAAPANVEDFRSSGQDETSISLQWSKVSNDTSFILQFNGTETNIGAPDGDGPVTHTVSSLTAATEYTFTVFSVFENVRSSGVGITAATAPPSVTNLGVSRQNETSVTLQWSKVSNDTSFILQFSGAETNIRAPDGDGPVTHTVSSLTPSTKYTFTVFSVFESVRSSGVSITAVTEGPRYVVGMKVRLSSAGELSQEDIQAYLNVLVERYGLLAPQLLSVKIKAVS